MAHGLDLLMKDFLKLKGASGPKFSEFFLRRQFFCAWGLQWAGKK
jgi:hypothetical protein